MIDKEAYLTNLREQVKAAEQRQELGLSDFRRASNSAEYKRALDQIATIRDPADVEKAMGLVRDKQEDIGIRQLALRKVVSGISAKPEYIADCFAILSDATESPELRKAVLAGLKTLSFASATFISLQSQYMARLRSLLDDPDASIRRAAAGELAMAKDEFVQRRLLSGLTGQEAPIVSDAKAIQLLGYDIHAEHYPVVRRLLENPESDYLTKLEAVHVLANDPESKQLLVNLMLDKEQDKELRMSSAMAVQAGHPRDFTLMAKTLVLDESENKDVRTVLLNALTLVHPAEKVSLHEDRQFLEKISRLHTSTTSPELRKMSSRYLENVRKQRGQ